MEHITSPAPACSICGNNNTKPYLSCPDHFLSQELFTLYICNTCSTLITWPKPDKEKIFEYYKSDEYVSHNDSSKGIINKIYQVIKTYSIKKKQKITQSYNPSNSLLDYGCGTGSFLSECVKSGIVAEGVEPEKSAMLLAQSKGLIVYTPKEFENISYKYGVITLWHVLEHTFDPVNTITQLAESLMDGGHLIIAVPNYLSNDAKHYKEFWAAYDVPRHLFHFNRTSIETLAKNTGLSLIKELPMYFDSYYVSMLSEKYKKGGFLKAIYQGLVSNIKARKTRNYSSLIYILRK